MFEPHDLNSDPIGNSPTIEDRLRAVQPISARIDRDRLMYLAGQRSMPAGSRPNRLWQATALASWGVCASLAVLLISQDPVIVTETKIVERIVEVPRQSTPGGNDEPGKTAVVRSGDSPARRPAFELQQDLISELLDDNRTLTLGDSRPQLWREDRRSIALAATTYPDATGATALPSRPATQAELRRELLNELNTGTLSKDLFLRSF